MFVCIHAQIKFLQSETMQCISDAITPSSSFMLVTTLLTVEEVQMETQGCNPNA